MDKTQSCLFLEVVYTSFRSSLFLSKWLVLDVVGAMKELELFMKFRAVD